METALTLPDGRALGVREYGDPDGDPVFFFHGVPGSRLGGELLDAPAAAGGVRLLALDRPGVGRSEFQRRRRLLDWPDDVADAADALGVDRFGVVGHSAGGPHAVACAHALPDRLTGVALVGSVTPPPLGPASGAQAAFPLARTAPWLAWGTFSQAAWLVRASPPAFRGVVELGLSAPDADLLDDDAVFDAVLAETREAFRRGPRGAVRDSVVLGRPWGFDLADVEPAVSLWHGARDDAVAPSSARALAAALPDCEARLLDDDGHLTPLLTSGTDALRAATG